MQPLRPAAAALAALLLLLPPPADAANAQAFAAPSSPAFEVALPSWPAAAVRAAPLVEATPLEAYGRRRPRAPPAAAAAPSAVADAVASLAAARAAQASGDYGSALRLYTRLADAHPGWGLAHTARLRASLLLLQTGDGEGALAVAEEEEAAGMAAGNAELQALTAVLLHAQRPLRLARAEALWAGATDLAPRFGDAGWVERDRGWPPAAVAALRRFLSLQG